jgi:uncharacterized protein YkwD
VLEATAYADVEPGGPRADAPAPGEGEAARGAGGDPGGDDALRLVRALDAARASAGLGALRRDPRLDRIALAHAEAMAARHELAHDAGDGDPLDRLRAAGLDPRAAGENVAHAATLALAHRAIWRSPSHRLNVLARDVDRVGVAVVGRPPDGAADGLWIVEIFAGGL